MNRHDREEIATFVVNMNYAYGPDARVGPDVLVRKFIDAAGVSGSGACICQWSPEKARTYCERTHETFDTYLGTLILDDRCDRHGEKAQPKVWGRHKVLELQVTPKQWLALGVEYDEANGP